jgi:hypothetical protein
MVLHIHIPVCNNPEFIRLQYHTLKRFCEDPFEITIFNDAKSFPDYSNYGDITLKQKISDICKELNLTCIDIQNTNDQTIITSASSRHSRTANLMWHQYEKNLNEPLLVLDSDMFPIRSFSIMNELKNYDFSYTLQTRENNVKYAWPNLFWCSPSKLIQKDILDWSTDPSRNCDTGGKSDRFLNLQITSSLHQHQHFISLMWNKNDIKEKVSLFPSKVIDFCENDIKNSNGKYWCEIYHDIFLHLRAGSNWEGIARSIHDQRTEAIKKVLTSI